jgi:hypothetical protein
VSLTGALTALNAVQGRSQPGERIDGKSDLADMVAYGGPVMDALALLGQGFAVVARAALARGAVGPGGQPGLCPRFFSVLPIPASFRSR